MTNFTYIPKSVNSLQITDRLKRHVELTLAAIYPDHSFATRVTVETVRTTLRNYLAFSESLPFLSTACMNEALKSIDIKEVLFVDRSPKAYVVASKEGERMRLLCLRYANGSYLNLPLRQDLNVLFGWELQADLSSATAAHLKRLHFGLVHRDPIDLYASTLAFELHKTRMIHSLRNTLTERFGWKTDKELHLELTLPSNPLDKPKVDTGIPQERLSCFLQAVERYYYINLKWCEDITSIGDS